MTSHLSFRLSSSSSGLSSPSCFLASSFLISHIDLTFLLIVGIRCFIAVAALTLGFHPNFMPMLLALTVLLLRDVLLRRRLQFLLL